MSSVSRASGHSDRRVNGVEHAAIQRPRVSANPNFKNVERITSSENTPSDITRSPQLGYGSTAHKRSASGNPRPIHRAGEDRSSRPHSRIDFDRERGSSSRTVEERRVESAATTVKESLYYRTKSPDHKEKRRSADASKAKPEPRGKDSIQKVWDPRASLIPHTTAPLARRISLPPRAAYVPQTLRPRPLGEMSLEEQESAIVEDLLFVFMGFEGQYIHFTTYNPEEDHDRLTGPNFKIIPGLDPSLLDLTNNMLQMASHYSALETFVDVQSREEFGSVSHALCASVRKLLTDYLVMITQLETQFLTNNKFTLHILNIHTLPTAQMLAQLHALAIELLRKNALLDDESDEESDESLDNDKFIDLMREGGGDLASSGLKKLCKGGGVLELITRRLEAMSGDPAAKALLTSLLRDASRPYMFMLNEWLHHGGIKDPHGEFLIKESKSVRRDKLEDDYTDGYWERRYALKKEDIPPQLNSVAGKIHLAGKYLNVVRECGGVDVSKEIKDVPTSFDDFRLLENVNGAYASANNSLMQLLLTTHQLPTRLRSLKHYFFLDPSDYFSHFLDVAHSELRKRAKDVNVGKLQSLLDLVLRQPGSVVSMDPFKDSVTLVIDEVSLINRLQRVVNISGLEIGEVPQLSSQAAQSDDKATGYGSIVLDYAVPFPVSLVISRKTVWRYQTLFRYLLSLRHLEQQLANMWKGESRGAVWAHRSSDRRIEIFKRRVWALRSRMLVFVQQMLYYSTAEVIEPNWQSFMGTLNIPDQPQIDGSGARETRDEEAVPSFPRTGARGIFGVGSDLAFTTMPTATTTAPPSRTVDELMQDHVDFLDTCLKECMLTNSKLLKINNKLTRTCSMFAHLSTSFSADVARADPDLNGDGNAKPLRMTERDWKEVQVLKAQAQAKSAGSHNSDSNTSKPGGGSERHGTNTPDISCLGNEEKITFLFKDLSRWESFFSIHLQKLIDALNHFAATETVVLLNLCARLSTVNQGTNYAGRGKDKDGDF